MFSLTKQEWFNRVWERAKLEEVAMVDQRCVYDETHNTPGCFIGASVTDQDARRQMSGRYCRASSLIAERIIGVEDGGEDLGSEFLNEMQSIHDNTPPYNWKRELATVADMHGLTVPATVADMHGLTVPA